MGLICIVSWWWVYIRLYHQTEVTPPTPPTANSWSRETVRHVRSGRWPGTSRHGGAPPSGNHYHLLTLTSRLPRRALVTSTMKLTMNLVVFDLDGTLTDTTHVDEHAIVGALQDVLGITDLSTDWNTYMHSTDAGIVHEVISAHRGGVAEEDLDSVQTQFFENMENFYTSSPGLFQPIPGAPDVLERLAHLGMATAIATGSWRESALFKLRVGGIRHAGVPLASSNDDHSRSAIIKTAILRAQQQHGVEVFERITYVGDGMWDARASRNLGIRFVGVARNGHADTMRRAGVEEVVADLTGIESVL